MNEPTVFSPLFGVVKSKQFWLIVIGGIVDTLIAVNPDFGAGREVLIAALTFLIGIAVHGYSMESAAVAQAQAYMAHSVAQSAQRAPSLPERPSDIHRG